MILSATGLNLSWPLTHCGDWYAPAGSGAVWTQGRVWGIYEKADGTSYIIDGGGSLSQDSAADIVFAGAEDDRVVGGLGADGSHIIPSAPWPCMKQNQMHNHRLNRVYN